MVQKKDRYRRGVLSRLDNNNPLVVEPETEKDTARAGCSAGLEDFTNRRFKALKARASDKPKGFAQNRLVKRIYANVRHVET
ncbi:hypothetical protein [Bradyrhizobium sp.]|uniref:hypothetical protein n=1 Tax=Bradyrhizobium sp. TaxID=376 RepID=UPI00262EA840|nr:hypothetical protein [Bradyrhizobium sp.]